MFKYDNGDVNDIHSSQTCWFKNLKACQIIWARWVVPLSVLSENSECHSHNHYYI